VLLSPPDEQASTDASPETIDHARIIALYRDQEEAADNVAERISDKQIKDWISRQKDSTKCASAGSCLPMSTGNVSHVIRTTIFGLLYSLTTSTGIYR
jgi:hypothetical protein